MSSKFDNQKFCCKSKPAGLDSVNIPGIIADKKEEKVERIERRSNEFCDPVCVTVDKVYDACRERNCVVDQRVYFNEDGQELIENAINVKFRTADIIWIYTNTEPLPYSDGYYSIDIKYFIDVTLEVFSCVSNPTEVHGLVTYDKKVILFGSEGCTKTFYSNIDPCDSLDKAVKYSNMPKVTVEVVDPIALSAKLVDENTCCCCNDCSSIPTNISNCYGQNLVVSDNVKKVLVSLGLFTIVRIERPVQLLIDAIDFCIPEKICPDASDQNPCDLFNQVRFPIDQFFPPIRPNDITSSNLRGCTPINDCDDCGCDCDCCN